MERSYYKNIHDFKESRLFQSGYVKGYHDAVMRCPDIVRCKDCKYWYNGCCYSMVSNRINFTVEVPDDWFCADGERKEG